jgi:hypothetical protein
MATSRSVNGAIAGSIAAAVWAAQQPLDKRVFGVPYDDVELLGKAVTRGSEWPAIGLGIHIANGAAFGALYATLRPFLFGPPVVRALTMSMAENFGSWPLVRLTDQHHPAKGDMPKLGGNTRALAQATWRHALFGAVLGIVEQRLNARREAEPPFVPVSSNGHGNIEHAATAAAS